MDGMKFEYEGNVYDVPCMPKKEWKKWMTSCSEGCRMPDAERARFCGSKYCPRSRSINCIYSYVREQDNTKARKAFYYECFPEEKPKEKPSCEECANYKSKEEPKKLPKLTQEVFERADCPEWAKWAAVDGDGRGWWFEDKPIIPAIPIISWVTSWKCKEIPPITSPFDATDWEHSLIEREIRYVACSSLKWPTLFKYSKLKDTYYVQVYDWAGPEWHIVGTTITVDSVPFDAVDVAPEFEDPAALVGTKVKLVNPSRYAKDQVFMIIQAGPRNAKLSSTGMDYGIDRFCRDFVKLDGSLLCTFKEY